MNKIALLLALALPLAAQAYVESTPRHATTAAAFRRHNACPATGKTQHTCKGYVVDHVMPLCAGGADKVENMQWQTAADSYKKDVQERALCRRLKAMK